MINTTGIHCKVSCNEELRRFLFTGTEFSSLKDQMKVVLGLNDEEFVLKYKDEEGDLITLSSNEELYFAISSAVDKGPLRLQAVVIDPNTKLNIGEKRPFEGCDRTQWKKKKWDERHERYHERNEKKHDKNDRKCEKRKKWEGKRSEKIEASKQHLREAIEKFSQMPPPQGFDWRQKKIEHLTNKLAWLESFSLEGGSPKSKPPKWNALTPEQKDQVEVLKAQIRSLKSPICELKAQIHSKKSEWPNAPEDRKFELSVEITKLKMEIKQLKEQIEPLKQQLSQIKH